MADKKFYAVKGEGEADIFDSWDKCKEYIKGKKVKHKSFKTYEEAKAFLFDIDLEANEINEYIKQGFLVAYTDGSYEHTLKKYSCGVCIFDGEDQKYFSGVFNNPNFLSSRNIAGEVEGILLALEYAKRRSKSKIVLFHDYAGLSHWTLGTWKTNTEISKYYNCAVQTNYMPFMQIKFVKVKGHSNNKYNDMVDKIAKQALFENKILPINLPPKHIYELSIKKCDIERVIKNLAINSNKIVYYKTENANFDLHELIFNENKITFTVKDNSSKVEFNNGKLTEIFIVMLKAEISDKEYQIIECDFNKQSNELSDFQILELVRIALIKALNLTNNEKLSSQFQMKNGGFVLKIQDGFFNEIQDDYNLFYINRMDYFNKDLSQADRQKMLKIIEKWESR